MIDDALYRLSITLDRPSVDERRMSARGLLATGARDRQGDVLVVEGVDCANHRINPVVMIDHGQAHSLPIGVTRDRETRAYTVEIVPATGQIWQTTFFSQKSQMAEQIFALIAEDVLRANSIGFRPIEAYPLPEDPEAGFHGKTDSKTGQSIPYKYIKRSELVEASWATIPVNPEAVSLALSRDRWVGKSLCPEIRSALLPYLPPIRLYGTELKADLAGRGTRYWPLPGIERKSMAAGAADTSSPRVYYVSKNQSWDESKHPRADDGKFGSGGSHADGGGDKPKPSHADRDSGTPPSSAPDAEIASKVGKILDFAKNLPKALYDKITTYASNKFTALRERYGLGHAISITALAIAGIPIPLPGSMILTAAPAIALAELHRKLSGAGKPEAVTMPAEALQREADALILEMEKKFASSSNLSDHLTNPSPSALARPTDEAAAKAWDGHRDKAGMLVSEWLRRSSLPPEKTERYGHAAATALDGMPAPCLAKFLERCGRIDFHLSVSDITDAFAKISGKRPNAPIGGFFTYFKGDEQGEIALDGGADTGEAYDMGGASAEDAAGIYAHEFTHAIDGPNKTYSSTPAWQQAAAKEILRPPYADEFPLSKYGAKNPNEAFAEYGRLLLNNPPVARERFPKCYAAWKEFGLLE